MNQCTDDSCDPSFGCINLEIDCDDNDDTTVDYCDGSAGCLHISTEKGY